MGTRPYNINDAWCASFTTYVWEQAGYKVDWTERRRVVDIWKDGNSLGLASTNSADARPGDMIIFDWKRDGRPGHVGIVVSVNGNQITTIEGNSSDRVKRNTYVVGDPRVTGVVKPPTQNNVAV
ncbi:CHAP domain-containing protein [Nocardia sp. NPDC049190]|uniref:CHAP domain-containing protein n=1 Tax=Nocardia sp. NPDC049190 TaxID=3155650 RepID=UPI003410B08B